MTQPATRPEHQPGGVHYEAGLLARIASSTDQREQFELSAELEAHRRGRAQAARHQNDLDLSGQVLAMLQPTAASEPWSRTTQDTDWLGDVDAGPTDLGEVTTAMVAEASTWYSRRLHPAVKAYPAEVLAQAESVAGMAAGPYGAAYPVAHRAFMDHVGHLVSRTADQVAPTSDQGPSTLPRQTFDGLVTPIETRPKADGTKPGDSPSLGEGDTPAGDVPQSLSDTPSQTGHDAGPGGLQHSVDYLDGHTTSPTNGSGMTSMSALAAPRGLAGAAGRFLAGLTTVADGPMPPVPTEEPPAAVADEVPCPQCLGEGALDDGSPCPLCEGSGMVTQDQAAQFEAAQGQVPPVAAGPPMPIAVRQARQRTAGVPGIAPMPSNRGNLTESLEEGDEPEGDHPATGERLAEPVSHDAGPGNGSATDYLDGRQYEWGTGTSTARRRQASPTLPGPGAPAPGGMPMAGPMGMPGAPMPAVVPGWEDQFVASLDPDKLAVVRQALHQTGGANTPLAVALHAAIARQQNALPPGTPFQPSPIAPEARLARFQATVASRSTAEKVDKGVRSGQHRGMTTTAAGYETGQYYSPPEDLDGFGGHVHTYNEGYEHARSGAPYKGYGGRGKAQAYNAGYSHGQWDMGNTDWGMGAPKQPRSRRASAETGQEHVAVGEPETWWYQCNDPSCTLEHTVDSGGQRRHQDVVDPNAPAVSVAPWMQRAHASADPHLAAIEATADEIHALAGSMPHVATGPGFTIHRRRYLPEDVYEGDIGTDYDAPEEVSFDPEFDEGDPVDWAEQHLRQNGLTGYSAYPDWQPGGWYDNSEVDPTLDHATGEAEQVSAHPRGFTDEQARELHRRLHGR